MIDYINRNVRVWDEIAKKQSISSYPFEKFLIEQYLVREDKILDYGCGFGRIIDYLKQRGYCSLYGCDPLGECVESCKKITSDVVQLSDVRALPFQENCFDAVIMIAVLSSVIPSSERVELIERLAKMTKTGGKLIVGDFLYSDLPVYKERYKQYSELEPHTFQTEDSAIIHHFSKNEIYNILNPYYEIQCFETKEAKSIHQRTLHSFMVVGIKK